MSETGQVQDTVVPGGVAEGGKSAESKTGGHVPGADCTETLYFVFDFAAGARL